MCPKHSEAKQTKMLESGAERFAAGSGRKSRQFVLQRLNSHMALTKSFYRRNLVVDAGVGLSSDWLVLRCIGQCFRNLTHQPFGPDQSGFHVLELSLKLPSSSWDLRSYRRTQRHLSDGSVHPLEEERGPCCIATLKFLDCPPLISASLLATDWICPLEFREDQGGWNLFGQTRNTGCRKALVPRRAPECPAWLQPHIHERFRDR